MFAPRKVFGDVLAQIEGWLAEDVTRNSGALPAFWISGRSGTGKSIALLHVLADLHAADEDRVIIWLKHRSDRLDEAVRWARPFIVNGVQVLLATDDPYTAQKQIGFLEMVDNALLEVSSIREEVPLCRVPRIICCGPSEQRDNFAEDLSDRRDVTLTRVGLEWLDKAAPDEDASWSFVWEELRKAEMPVEGLDAIGRRWLRTGSVAKRSWSYVWMPLWEASNESDEELLTIAERWLLETPVAHSFWSLVWSKVWKAKGQTDAKIAELGRLWARAHITAAAWPLVWKPLWQFYQGADPELRQMAVQWLKRQEQPLLWPSVWRRLWDIAEDRAELTSIGLQWVVHEAGSAVAFGRVWGPLWNALANNLDLVTAGLRWLGKLRLRDNNRHTFNGRNVR